MSRCARSLGALALAGVALLGACAEPMASPDAGTAPVRTVHLAAPATLSGRYLVSFRGAEPADFAASVAALGATIERRLPSVRAAVLRNVNAAAAAALGARSDLDGIAGDMGAQMVPAPVVTQRLTYAGAGAPRATGTDQSGAFSTRSSGTSARYAPTWPGARPQRVRASWSASSTAASTPTTSTWPAGWILR